MVIAAISLSLGLPFLLLYTRKMKWQGRNLKQVLVVVMTAISVIGLTLSNTNESRLFFYAFITTPIYLLVDMGFKFLSIKRHSRDFYLWLRFSDEIDDSFSGIDNNKHIKTSDVIFSISLLILIIGLCAFGAVLFGKK